jgi:hypothetical protein
VEEVADLWRKAGPAIRFQDFVGEPHFVSKEGALDCVSIIARQVDLVAARLYPVLTGLRSRLLGSSFSDAYHAIYAWLRNTEQVARLF